MSTYVQPEGTVFHRVRPDGGHALAHTGPIGAGPRYLVLERLEADGTRRAQVTFAADELDELGAAIARARALLIGAPDPKAAIKSVAARSKMR